MPRAYYALVAGLPDLLLDNRRLPYSAEEFWNDSSDYLLPDDRALLGLLCLPVDNANVLALLEERVDDFQGGGNFSQEVLEQEIKVPAILPEYLRLFIERYTGDGRKPEGTPWATVLAAMFYEAMQAHPNAFVRDWFTFDANVRNVLVALNARKLNVSADPQLAGHNTVSDAIRKNNSGDFGLGREFAYIEKIIALFDGKNLLEREQGLDMLRWETVEKMTVFEYFSIEKVMAFFVKLQIAERWYSLDQEKGEQIFEKLIEELRSGLDMSKEFSVSGGK